MNRHLWHIAPHPAAREDATVEVNCHHLLRGPYTGLGAVLRALVPDISRHDRALVGRPAESESMVMELRGLSARPDIHIVTGYPLAMMYTRYWWY